MTAMPQMVALFNGVGGGAAALVALAEFHIATARPRDDRLGLHRALGADRLDLVRRLDDRLREAAGAHQRPADHVPRPEHLQHRRPARHGRRSASRSSPASTTSGCCGSLVGLALLFGVLFVLPIGGADMPVVISLLNAFTGLAASATGFVLSNTVLIVAGMLVGASGTMLTLLMAKAMNRSVTNVLFGAFGQIQAGAGTGMRADDGRTVRATTPEDVAVQLSFARKVVVVPGYGMAVAQAQHDVRQLAELLEEKGVEVKYAIHPVAGRMPGHMNVLLAEANVPYDVLKEMDEINPEFPQTDVALVIGANDVTNPAARHDTSSPIYGMPILDVDKAASVIVMKRSMNPGFAGIDNELYLEPQTTMLFGDAKDSVVKLIAAVKQT